MAALCTVSADFLHHLHVLSDPHGKPECNQGNGPQRSVSEVGDQQEDHGPDPAPADLPHQRDGNGLQPDPEQPAEPAHQYMAEQKITGLSLSGTAERPRLCVYRSNANIYAQIIDDVAGNTLVQASTLDKEIKIKHANKEAAKELGTLIAKRAADKKIKTVVFDRGGYIYHGVVKELAEAAREGGLEF